MARHDLTVQGHLLCLEGEQILAVHPEGDCDHIEWPFVDDGPICLFHAMFDEGNIDGGVEPGEVYLPDGMLFGEIVPCGFNLAEGLRDSLGLLTVASILNHCSGS